MEPAELAYHHRPTTGSATSWTWERATLQPKYGINEGIEYTHTIGVAEIYDYEWFFGGFPRKVWGQTAEWLGVTPGQKVVYFPRRSFDMWNTRYFILPWYPNGWLDESRGFAAFLEESELIYPPHERFQGADKADEIKAWIETHDYQIRRNRQAYPRAWVVHDARRPPSPGGPVPGRAERTDAGHPLRCRPDLERFRAAGSRSSSADLDRHGRPACPAGLPEREGAAVQRDGQGLLSPSRQGRTRGEARRSRSGGPGRRLLSRAGS